MTVVITSLFWYDNGTDSVKRLIILVWGGIYRTRLLYIYMFRERGRNDDAANSCRKPPPARVVGRYPYDVGQFRRAF